MKTANDLIGFKPQYPGQSLSDYMAGRDDPLKPTVQATDYQGRLKTFESPEAVAQNHAQGRASYDAASAERNDSISFRRDDPSYATGSAPRANFNAPLPGEQVPTGVRRALMAGKNPERVADWAGSTQGKAMGGVGALKDDLLLSPFQKTARDQQLENSIASNNRAEESHAAKMAQDALNLDESARQAEIERQNFEASLLADQNLGNQMADVLEQQNPGLGTTLKPDLALEAAIENLRSGNLDAADELLGMRPPARGSDNGSSVPAPNARDREITDVMETYGIPRSQALGLVDGTTRLVTDPVSGNTSMINMVTGKAQSITVPDAIQAELDREALNPGKGASEPAINLYQMAQKTTGLMPALLANAQRITGQIGINTAPPELIENIQTFKAAQNEIIRALSINPRFPVAEINRIKEEISIEPGVFKDASTLQSQLRSVDGYLRNRLSEEQLAAGDTNLPKADRQEALSAARNISSFLKIIGVPKEEAIKPVSPEVDPEVTALINKYTNQGGSE